MARERNSRVRQCVEKLNFFLIPFFVEIQDFPARVQRQVFDDILDREVQRGKKGCEM